MVKIEDKIGFKHIFKKSLRKFKKEIILKQKNNSNYKINQNGEYEFHELKGSGLPFELKEKLVKHLTFKNHLNVYYILIENKEMKDIYYENTARAFNYVLKLCLLFLVKNSFLNTDDIFLHIDERNTKTGTIHCLEEYLNTEFKFSNIDIDFKVKYTDSKKDIGVQVADLFSNVFYSTLLSKEKSKIIDELKEKNCIKHIFRFPLKNQNPS